MKRPARKSTIYDIAQRTGASPSTVSAALNGTWQKRRIKESTALEVQRLAADLGYTTNMQARGLRSARSGLIGMILPAHFNRYFSSLSQIFEAHARARGLCPVIVSTLRDEDEERHTVETLISYAIDSLFIVGASNPDALSDICTAVNLRHINIDLPGTKAPSVVSDNYSGAKTLTREIVRLMPKAPGKLGEQIYFIGGAYWDNATAERIRGFKDVIAEQHGEVSNAQIFSNSYEPDASTIDVREICERIGGIPTGIFVNSTFAFEGVLKYFSTQPVESFVDTIVGCYDYDPFATFMHFPVVMIRQNVEELIAQGFRILDEHITDPRVIKIEPELIHPRSIYLSPHETLKRHRV
jgi:LacI family transcriptional regulator, fructose operon transcriptional repressor